MSNCFTHFLVFKITLDINWHAIWSKIDYFLTIQWVISTTLGKSVKSPFPIIGNCTFSENDTMLSPEDSKRYCYFIMATGDGSKKHYLLLSMAHNWQKWKRVFLTCPCHEIYRDEAAGLKKCKYTWKNYDLCEYVEFGAISWTRWFANQTSRLISDNKGWRCQGMHFHWISWKSKGFIFYLHNHVISLNSIHTTPKMVHAYFWP